jgi:hypothetical protein
MRSGEIVKRRAVTKLKLHQAPAINWWGWRLLTLPVSGKIEDTAVKRTVRYLRSSQKAFANPKLRHLIGFQRHAKLLAVHLR